MAKSLVVVCEFCGRDLSQSASDDGSDTEGAGSPDFDDPLLRKAKVLDDVNGRTWGVWLGGWEEGANLCFVCAMKGILNGFPVRWPPKRKEGVEDRLERLGGFVPGHLWKEEA